MKFNPGNIIISSKIKDYMQGNESFSQFIINSISRHTCGDWGVCNKEDRELNELSINTHSIILSKYLYGVHKIYVLTEADKLNTFVIFPDEY